MSPGTFNIPPFAWALGRLLGNGGSISLTLHISMMASVVPLQQGEATMPAANKPAQSSPLPRRRDIPTEVLAQIAQYLDRRSSIAFARVARRFTAIATPKIWSELELCLPANYGLRAYVPPEKMKSSHLEAWHETEVDMAEDRRGTALEAKVRAIINRGNEDRWKLVRRIKVVLRPGIQRRLMTILDLTSQHVEELEVDGSDAGRGHPSQDGPSYSSATDEFDRNLLHNLGTLTLGALTHVRIGPSSLFYPPSLLLLYLMAPGLLSLDVDLNRSGHPGEGESASFLDRVYSMEVGYEEDDPFETGPLERLRYVCNEDEDILGSDDSGTLVSILRRSRHLRQLYVYNSTDDSDLLESILARVHEHPAVEVVHFRMYMGEYNGYRRDVSADKGCEHLRKFILSFDGALDILEEIPEYPVMETFFLYKPNRAHEEDFIRLGAGDGRYPARTEHPTLLPSFAARIRNSPKLHSIRVLTEDFDMGDIGLFERLDAVELSEDSVIGRVTSLRHGSHELLHVRLLLPYREIANIREDCDDYDDGRYTAITYTAEDGSPMQKVFAPLAEAEWMDVWDYEGRVVPLEVVEQMRAVEGLGRDEARGIEVGDAAWTVLTDWVAARDGDA